SKRIRILSGSGPYAISQINNLSDIYFKAHKNFYRGRPFLNKIHIKFYDNEQKKISDFIKGKTDLVFFNDYGTAKIINQFTGKNSIIFEVTRKFPKLYVILLNQNTPLFKNKTNRKALEFCINKNTIFTQSIKIQERGFFFAPGSPYANNLINGRKYDPLKAISLLQANGWKMGQQGYVLKKNGMEFNFLLYFDRGSQLQENAVRNIQIQLAEIGINVVPVPINPMDKIKLLQNGTFSAMLMSFPINENNPLPAFSGLYDTFIKKQFSSLNIFGKQIVGLNEQLLTNKISMSRFFNEIHSVFYVNVPMIFLGSQSTQYVAQKSAFKKTRMMYKNNNKIYYYLSPFEDWYLPIDFQR
ncbi:MAG: hypothetical protein KAR38_08095, partial [Calditrichia bacterium]|nr:hypothetical protein [Calditrichia bacterium]